MKFQEHNTIHGADSFAGLLGASLSGDRSAACWRRSLAGDFDEVARRLAGEEDVLRITEARLRSLAVSAEGKLAIDVMLEDLGLLRRAGHDPELSCITRYPRDPDEILPTDVHSFHVDSANGRAETFLCSYTAPASEGLHRSEATRAVDLPQIRQRLLAQYGGADDESFDAYLGELHYDLHYLPNPTARPFSFGVGHLWRLAVQAPGSAAPAMIHRAPPTRDHSPAPRLLLIS